MILIKAVASTFQKENAGCRYSSNGHETWRPVLCQCLAMIFKLENISSMLPEVILMEAWIVLASILFQISMSWQGLMNDSFIWFILFGHSLNQAVIEEKGHWVWRRTHDNKVVLKLQGWAWAGTKQRTGAPWLGASKRRERILSEQFPDWFINA